MSESTDNYLKAIFTLSEQHANHVSTTALAEKLQTKASSVSDMLKKLDSRGYVKHTRYYGVALTAKGKKQALQIVRKHRLWELFLVEKLGFGWNEVHEIAEQLEHVESEALVKKLDEFLGHPKYDPHGDPIPDAAGVLPSGRKTLSAQDMKENETYAIAAVTDDSEKFLNHLKTLKLQLGTSITLLERYPFDHSIRVETNDNVINLSQTVAGNLILQKTKRR